MRAKVISRSQLPTRYPLTRSAFTIFLLHYFNAPIWLWLIVCSFVLVEWITKTVAILFLEGEVLMVDTEEGYERMYESCYKRDRY